MPLETRFIAVNGARLGYEVRSEGSGLPPAVFVHGYSGRSTGEATYGELLGALADAFTIYALDLRGHGASAAATENWSLSMVADDVAAFARALGIEGAFYIGHSIGAFTGMFCEVRNPGTFSALCLLNTASAEGGSHSAPEAGQLLIQHGRDRDVMREALIPMYVRGGDPTPHADAAALMDRRVHELFYEEYPNRIIIDEVRRITIPVLAINGALDNVVPLFTQHATAMAIPNCKEIILMSEGHLMPLEAPAMTAREIITFWTHDLPDIFAPDRRPPVRADQGAENLPVSLPADRAVG